MPTFQPRVGGAKTFWNTIKSISVDEIAREANRPLSVAIIGDKLLRAEAIKSLFESPKKLTDGLIAMPESPFLLEYENSSEEAGFPIDPAFFDIVIDVGNGRKEAPEGSRLYSVAELNGWDATLNRILEDRPDLALALARNFPVFRKAVGDSIINLTATVNAQFSLVTGVTAAFPLLGFLLPVNGLSDILMLTKNQVMMTLRLAAAHGLDLNYKSRLKELAPILINGFGWRAIARELVGAIPVVGFVARAGIAYAGTVTVGKAAQVYYETGENISRSQIKRWYKDSLESSRGLIRRLALTTRKGDNISPVLTSIHAGELAPIQPREENLIVTETEIMEPEQAARKSP